MRYFGIILVIQYITYIQWYTLGIFQEWGGGE